MAASLRRLVSQKKVRYQEDGFDLDLTYVTPRVIAMGFPASGVEAVYRNPMKEVKRLLEAKHGAAYKVYNLCAESKHQYAPDAFAPAQQTDDYEFEDHNALPLPILADLATDVAAFLAADDANVVAIHCKAGKGRTGLVVASLLLHLGEVASADAALEHFASVRTSDGKGVSVPSQKRYVQYYASLLDAGLRDAAAAALDLPSAQRAAALDAAIPRATIVLDAVTMHTVPKFDVRGGCDPYVVVDTFHDGELVRTDTAPHVKNEDSVTIDLPGGVTVGADFRVTLYDADVGGGDDLMCYFWLNPAQLLADAPAGEYVLPHDAIDGVHKDKKKKHFDPSFALAITFHAV
ncbi:phosphatase tensin domain-containing protein [Thecamonas trahens ATCC 50062]|uniref:Phosphatase tensin domain-containing protein n=1 Tax=Thecamonas trahens ATCC 50062 TaxID=461836 RepID=A0A0L0D1U0_THETB|nr:phosphatase tensin domain-containing protein [Thecamonas trahens ATCC 50062]KNC46070.1 phosphatase tensin domain-containing protein [Thecamonas trahens ATCC 50062]|eukprot:XP_013763050.1 phosphatase tensin domain-containing protein [Thecamonas trahens ATCC 50062]